MQQQTLSLIKEAGIVLEEEQNEDDDDRPPSDFRAIPGI